MIQKTFISEAWNGRPISIKIEKTFISFSFPRENDREFYDIQKDEWINDKTERQGRPDNWHNHMREKTWFTEEMAKFINENTLRTKPYKFK